MRGLNEGLSEGKITRERVNSGQVESVFFTIKKGNCCHGMKELSFELQNMKVVISCLLYPC